MNTTNIIVAVSVLLIMGTVLGLIFARRTKRTERLHGQFGSEYDHTVKSLGNEKKAQTELEERQRYVKALDIRPLTVDEHTRYLADWAAVQSSFVDEPRRAIVEADRLIMEVMELRAYPVADFEQRAADVSVNYPALVSNYRAAREVAVRNEDHHAGTEDLRKALINYRSLFDELLVTDAVVI